jgi:hypothetical protein
VNRYTDHDNLETCLQQIDDPAQRAELIEQAFQQLCQSLRPAESTQSETADRALRRV